VIAVHVVVRKRTVVAVVTTKHKNVGLTRVAIAVAAVLVVPALLNRLTNEVLRARHSVPGAFYLINGRPMHLYRSGHGAPTVVLDAEGGTTLEVLSQRPIRPIWNSMQEGLKALSPRARRVIARGSGHGVMIDRPDVVTRGIREISAAAATHEGVQHPFAPTADK
jgi:pimeloyl-ACP methyl ester carboxylesterase